MSEIHQKSRLQVTADFANSPSQHGFASDRYIVDSVSHDKGYFLSITPVPILVRSKIHKPLHKFSIGLVWDLLVWLEHDVAH